MSEDPDHRAALRRYLLSEATSLLGNSVVMVVLPLVVYVETGSSAAMGVVAAATTVPALAIASIGGWVVDRFDRRRLTAAADLVSAASVAAVPLVQAIWGLNLGWFIVLGVLGSVGDLPGMTAREALGPTLAARAGVSVEKLAAQRETLGALSLLVGPGLAGAVLWRVDPVAALWVASGLSSLAALATLTLPGDAGAYERDATLSARGALAASVAGFTWIGRDPTLRRVVALSSLAVAVIGTLQAVVLPVHLADQGHRPHLGTVFAVLSLGTIVGGVAYAALNDRYATATWFRAGLVLILAGVVGLASLPELWLLLVASFVLGLGAAPTNAVAGAAVINRIPEGVRGRVLGAQNVLMLGVLPVSLLPAAVVADRWGLAAVGWALAALWLLTTVWTLSSPPAFAGVGREPIRSDPVSPEPRS